ncbi:MAG: methionine gamma-lyase family protein, partial [Catonella sp.]|uniref:methionine gamma-lyase family protein n=1 Tax=Catonella sp. TaxID=2382125 RepID=UPI003F9F8FC5
MGISEQVFDYCEKICENLNTRFKKVDEIAEVNQLKVLKAMQKNRVSDIHFAASSGYGYNDLGRDTLESVYADVFHTEAALVRPSILCGTHALTVAMFGNLRPGDEILSPVGKPYDTLDGVIGITPMDGSLAEYGVSYRQVDLLNDFSFDYEGIKNAINSKTKLVTIQRSKGYDV